MRDLWLKTYLNKKTNQISIALPRKKIKSLLDENKVLKKIKIKIEDLKW